MNLFDYRNRMLGNGCSESSVSIIDTTEHDLEPPDYLEKGIRIETLARERVERLEKELEFSGLQGKLLKFKDLGGVYPKSSDDAVRCAYGNFAKKCASRFRTAIRACNMDSLSLFTEEVNQLFSGVFTIQIEPYVGRTSTCFSCSKAAIADKPVILTVRDVFGEEIRIGCLKDTPITNLVGRYFIDDAMPLGDIGTIITQLYSIVLAMQEVDVIKESSTDEIGSQLGKKYVEWRGKYFANIAKYFQEISFEEMELPEPVKESFKYFKYYFENMKDALEWGEGNKHVFGESASLLNYRQAFFVRYYEEMESGFCVKALVYPNKRRKGAYLLHKDVFSDLYEMKRLCMMRVNYLNGLHEAIELQKELLKTEHAKSFQTKKNIPEKVLTAMKESGFNKYFGYVEFDELCDTKLCQDICKEFEYLYKTMFPRLRLDNHSLRFRRLGNRKAEGIYFFFKKCMCVDINYPSAFIHELGHLIDYEYKMLSLNAEFFELLQITTEAFECQYVNGTIGYQRLWNKKKSYYLKPTEVFARSFEVYMANKIPGISLCPTRDELLTSKFYFLGEGYEELEEKIIQYFDFVLFGTGGMKAYDDVCA